MKEIIQSRKMSQPTGQKTGGSTFKNINEFEEVDDHYQTIVTGRNYIKVYLP